MDEMTRIYRKRQRWDNKTREEKIEFFCEALDKAYYAGYSQSTLAYALGISRQYVTDMKYGRRIVPFSVATVLDDGFFSGSGI